MRRVAALRGATFTGYLEATGLDPRHDLCGENLRNADFGDADIAGWDLRGANLAGADLSRARNVGKALIDDTTTRREDPAGLPDLAIFRDRIGEWGVGPEMVVIPAGSFLMGSPESDPDAGNDEKPQRQVKIERRFALGRGPVTFEEYDRFCAATNRRPPRDHGWGRGRRPAIGVGWQDARAYCRWLRLTSKAAYRLPSEVEWEYACRAGTTTRYWWGDDWDPTKANGDQTTHRTTEVGAYPANPWKLWDILGNVWEWCADHWAGRLAELPSDGTAHVEPKAAADALRVVRGGSWNLGPGLLRCAFRFRGGAVNRYRQVGFRVARML